MPTKHAPSRELVAIRVVIVLLTLQSLGAIIGAITDHAQPDIMCITDGSTTSCEYVGDQR